MSHEVSPFLFNSSNNEKTGDGSNVEESSTLPSAASQRRKRVSGTSSLGQPPVSAPSQSRPLSTVNHDAPQPNPTPAKEKQPCSDRYRIYKARKLREMLKEELRKEKVSERTVVQALLLTQPSKSHTTTFVLIVI